jgi:hypothetical protein
VELLYKTPRYQDEEVVLTGYGLGDVDDRIGGEDEETARRFGWWPKRSTTETVTATFSAWARDWAYASDEDVTDIACDVAVDNVASRRVAENGGFSDPTPYTDPDGHAALWGESRASYRGGASATWGHIMCQPPR